MKPLMLAFVALFLLSAGCSSYEKLVGFADGGVSPEDIDASVKNVLEKLGVFDEVTGNIDIVLWSDKLLTRNANGKEDLGEAYEKNGLRYIEVVNNPDILYESGRINSYREWEINLELALLVLHETRHHIYLLPKDEEEMKIDAEIAAIRRSYVSAKGFIPYPEIEFFIPLERAEKYTDELFYTDPVYKYKLVDSSGDEMVNLDREGGVFFLKHQYQGEAEVEGVKYAVYQRNAYYDSFTLTLYNDIESQEFHFSFNPYEQEEEKYVFRVFLN